MTSALSTRGGKVRHFSFAADEWVGPKKYSNSSLHRTVPYRSVVCVDYVDDQVRVALINGDVITFFGGQREKYDPAKLKVAMKRLPEKSALFEIADTLAAESPVVISQQCWFGDANGRIVISVTRTTPRGGPVVHAVELRVKCRGRRRFTPREKAHKEAGITDSILFVFSENPEHRESAPMLVAAFSQTSL